MNRLVTSVIIGSLLGLVLTVDAASGGVGIIWQPDDVGLESEYGIQVQHEEVLKSYPTTKNTPKHNVNTVQSLVDDLTNTKIAPLIQELESFYNQYHPNPSTQTTSQSPVTTSSSTLDDTGLIDIVSADNVRKTEQKNVLEGRLTLDKSIELALDYQYKIRASALDLNKTKILESVSAGKWYPQINYKHRQNLKELLGQVDLVNGRLTNKDQIVTKYTSGITIKQSLNVKSLALGDSKAKLATKSEAYKLEQVRQVLSLAISGLFLDTLHFSDKVVIADEFQKIASNLKALVDLRFKAGKVALLDKKKMELSLELSLAEQQHFNTQLQNASVFLGRAIGIDGLTGSELVPVELGVENFDRYRLSLKDFVKENINYLQSVNNLALVSNEEQTLKTNLYPSVEMNASIDRNAAIVGKDYTRTSLLLDISYSVWSGGIDTNKLKSSRVGKQASQYRLKATEEEVLDIIEKNFTDYEQSVKQYKTYYKNRLISRDLFDIQYDAFKIGKKINLIELVSSLSNWYNNYLKSKRNYYDALNNKYKFSSSIGRII